MKRIPLLLGTEQECSYLPLQRSRLIFVEPAERMDRAVYSALANQGFRRSGNLVYRPYCASCRACVPIRIPVSRFRPNRTQARIMRRNSDLEVIVKPSSFSESHYQLFQRYLGSRHADGDMAGSSREDYVDFLTSDWAGTSFVEFRDSAGLVAVAIMDRLDMGLSAVYTFFDPAHAARSPGTFAVLWQIDEARRLGLNWIYLGFWIEDCRKMNYKDRFRPLQAFIDGDWRLFEKGEKIRG